MAKENQSALKGFMRKHFLHFNAAVVVSAAEAWVDQLRKGNKMFVAMAGAMSTAEIGISLAELIRNDKVHAISTTGANLEEDLFNLVAHNAYEKIPHYRDLTPKDEMELRNRFLHRVTDTCIPEDQAMRLLEGLFVEEWQKAEKNHKALFPYEFFYNLIRDGKLEKHAQIDPKNSWVLAACEKNLPIFTPGWEDSTLGNCAAAMVVKEKLKSTHFIKTGLDQMIFLIHWYRESARHKGVGFFQIGGGIAGDFPICVLPLLRIDMGEKKTQHWSYFCQISDSTTSYGSYSGAIPNEKITWDKLSVDTPRFVIESDASIVAPLIFQYVLES